MRSCGVTEMSANLFIFIIHGRWRNLIITGRMSQSFSSFSPSYKFCPATRDASCCPSQSIPLISWRSAVPSSEFTGKIYVNCLWHISALSDASIDKMTSFLCAFFSHYKSENQTGLWCDNAMVSHEYFVMVTITNHLVELANLVVKRTQRWLSVGNGRRAAVSRGNARCFNDRSAPPSSCCWLSHCHTLALFASPSTTSGDSHVHVEDGVDILNHVRKSRHF